MNNSLIIPGIIFILALIPFVYSCYRRITTKIKSIPNPLTSLFSQDSSKIAEEEKPENEELTGDINPNYLFLNKLRRLIEYVDETPDVEWDQKIVTDLGFRLYTRSQFIRLFAQNNPNMKPKTFDFMPRFFFILAIPPTAVVAGHNVVEDGNIEIILYAENIMYCYADMISLDDAITEKGLSDFSNHIVFNSKLYRPEDFVEAGFEDKINWMMQKG